MPRNRFRSLLLCFTASLLLFSCAARQKNITNLPPGVTQTQVQNWDTAVANLDKISTITTALRQAVIGLRTQGVITDDKVYAAILTSLGKVTLLQVDAANFLKAQPNNWGADTQTKVKNDLALIQAELNAITQQQLAGIKNPSAQQQVQQLIAEIGSAAALIISLV
jgi:hypothetical protein